MLVFSFPAPLFIVIPTLILAVLVNGWPSLPPSSSPALPLVKLPLGYYRDVFINAVYVPLSALFLSLRLPPHFPHLSSPLLLPKMTSSSFSPLFPSVCLAAFSFILSLSARFFLPFFSLLFLCRNLIILLISSPAAVNVTWYASLIASN